jgi:pimeloyl-ACP methyl ester carboxylesterase
MTHCKEEAVRVRGRKVHLYRGGAGTPLLFLHDTFCPRWLPIHESLSAHFEVFVPLHHGCAGSEEGFGQFDEMEDVVFHYLDVCETLRLDHPSLIGASFGGWIAAEWAVRYSGALDKLILTDALGLRLSDAPAADILSLDPVASRQAIFANPSSNLALEVIPNTPKGEELVNILLARQALARFAWQFPDNPRLRRYLYRVQIPTLIVWGEADRFVPVAHGKAYHEGIAKAELIIISNAGHLPHVETPGVCADVIVNSAQEINLRSARCCFEPSHP